MLVCSGEGDGDAQAAAAEGMVIPPGPLLEPRDLCRLLKDRVTLLPVENLAPPAFACFKACLQAVSFPEGVCVYVCIDVRFDV